MIEFMFNSVFYISFKDIIVSKKLNIFLKKKLKR